MTKVYEQYKGKWVALSGPKSNKVVVSGRSAKTVYETAVKKGYKIPTLFKVPVKDMIYIG